MDLDEKAFGFNATDTNFEEGSDSQEDGPRRSMRNGRDPVLEKEEKDKTKALFTVTYFNHNPFSRVICFMKDIWINCNCNCNCI